ncbi:MAG: CD1107 family mobile element protein [Candidatus Diapherotrites archaeon]
MKFKTALIFFGVLLILGFISATAPTVLVIQPNGSQYIKGSYTIDFNVTDNDSNSIADSNLMARIYYSSTQGAFTTLITDLNLMNTSVCGDQNFVTTNNCTYSWNTAVVTDGNYFIDINVVDSLPNGTFRDSGSDSSNTSFMIDNTAPTTSWDGNTTWQKIDANIHLTCVDASNNCPTTKYRVDTDSSSTVSYGSWTTYDTNIFINSDGNWALDFNSTDAALNIGDVNTFYVLIDQTAPVVTISNPADGSSQTSTGVTLVYSATNTGDINKYYVQVDSNGWVDNSTNLSYDFNNLTTASHTFYVIAQTKSDVNSSTASVTISVTSPPAPNTGGLNYCRAQYIDGHYGDICNDDEECTGQWLTALDSDRCCSVECTPAVQEVCGNGICTGDENASNCPADCQTETKETVLEKVISYKPTSEEIRNKLTEVGASENAIEKASQAVGKTTVSRTITVEKITDTITGEISYQTTMTININNPGKKKTNIKIIEFIPKSVALNASQIKSDFEFTILKEDPVIEFSIDEVNPNQTKNITYTIDDEVSNQAINEMTAPIVAEFAEEEPLIDLCKGKNCDDNNPCTQDSCDSTTGECSNTNLTEGTSCGTTKECKNGKCITKTVTDDDGKEPQKPEETDFTPFIILIILIIIAGAAYYYFKIQKPKNDLTYKK